MVYRIKGKRYLKMYTAPCDTPVYAANTDAKAAAEDLDDVPWTPTDVQSAQMSYHTNAIVDEATQTTGLDMNVAIRESFDAALFCANHVAGLHRAYANAACYVFEMPEMAAYPNLTSVKARVTSDPYNSTGVRLAVHLSDTLSIPQEWSIAREGIAHVAGAVPRDTAIGSDKKTYWFTNTGEVEIEIAAQQLKKHLLLMVGLEDYTVVRGDWMEGSAYISPTVEITTDGEVTGWIEGRTETAAKSVEFMICDEDQGFSSNDIITRDGDLPEGITADQLGANVATDWSEFSYKRLDMIAFSENRMKQNKDVTIAQVNHQGEILSKVGGSGAAYTVGKDEEGVFILARKKLLVPFVIPDGMKTGRMKVSWTHSNDYAAVKGTPTIRNIWIARNAMEISYGEKSLQKYQLYTATLNKVDKWELLKSLECTVGDVCAEGVELEVDIESGKAHTLLLTCHIDEYELVKIAGSSGANASQIMLGDGWNDPYAMYLQQAVQITAPQALLWKGMVLSGGWSPKITLKN
ncbi:MAG: hypothetical protein E7046_06645 [Lentisphaerae bacterium]|nr:hypothetical protein [Lentisphaerota bacterium]